MLVARDLAEGTTPDLAEVKALYLEAFPRIERIPFWLLRMLARRKEVDFLGFYDEGHGGVLAGIAHVVKTRDLLYLTYLAVNPQIRGRGYGSAILERLGQLYPGRRMLLMVEPADVACDNRRQRQRRLAFYERNGFSYAGFGVHDLGADYDILARGGAVSPRDFERAHESYLGSALYRLLTPRITHRR